LGEYKGERNLYTEFPEIDRNEFIETVSKYTDIKKALATLFVYYALNFQNMSESDAQRIDLICEKINLCANDSVELTNLLSQAVDVLENTPKKDDGGKKMRLVNLMIDFLNADLNKPLNLNEFAKRQSISKYYLCHIFEKKTSFEINKYRDICRMTKAKELLITTTLTVSDICKECGFETEGIFLDKFIRNEGITPKEYRKYNKKRA
jgi:AraC-like DNA-binding protein